MKTIKLKHLAFLFITVIGCSSNDDFVDEVVPLAPTSLTGSLVNGQINLSWVDNATNETGYKIERKTSSSNYSLISTVGSNITTYLDANISTDQTYTYRVYSYNSRGNSTNYSNEFTISISTPITLPTITTSILSALTSNAVNSGGNITSDGGATVTSRGIVWSTSQNPTVALTTKTIDGSGIGTFTSNITALSPNTQYYLRAYASNSAGTAYGNEINFTTLTNPVTLPTISTTTITALTSNAVNSGGNITSDGGATVTSRGIVWSTSQNPTVALTTKTIDGSGIGTFTSNITALSPNTQYYLRAYASNSAGTAYGNEINFTTLPTIGQVYQGGVIAYILQPGDPGYVPGEFHGIISAPSDQVINITWSNGGSTISTGATGTALGTGNSNTNTIVNVYGNGNYAAKLCFDLVLNGFSDWYLPSRSEMSKMILNKDAIGGFSSANYWSSTELSGSSAYYSNFTSGSSNLTGSKNSVANVRAVRSF